MRKENHGGRQEIYFCLKLTEAEHYIVAEALKSQCERLGIKLLYYRKLKDGHVPMIREAKVVGKELGAIIGYLHQHIFGDSNCGVKC